MTGGLTERTAEIAAASEQRAGPQLRVALAAVRARLAEPLRVAVVGGVNAGKSTLVNALLSQVVAPTDVSECTQVVTEFRYGFPQRGEAVLRSGDVHPVALQPGGRLPSKLNVDPSDVVVLRVWLTNPALSAMTLIDTPGLNSANVEYSARTEQLLRMDVDTKTAAGGADVVLFVLRPSVNASEIAALREFSSASGLATGSPLTALGVLTKADKVDLRGDPWIAAARLAQTQSTRLQSDLALVVPVLGLLAQTAETYALTEEDADAIAALAALPEDNRMMMLWDAERFREACPTPELADRLLGLLDLHGIALSLEMAAVGATGATALQEALATRAGLVGLRQAIADTFLKRADALKAHEAARRLLRASYAAPASDAAVAATLRAGVEALLDDPDMHELDELRELHAYLVAGVELPDDLAADLGNLLHGDTPSQRCGLGEEASAQQVAAAAMAAAQRWRRYENNAIQPEHRAAARVFRRSFTLLCEGSDARVAG